ncbi:hypothetical protein P171DRAFT_504413 [Karstenula rhodostoma CBS 690.94]|uniref:Uncharacterized protein n=1 Tax=Karstenula rhodostoma CBS 690.94 TaxID=1392251 RepID=A0A9P4U6L6_9PLEO|nr:hypothetical protein P171DRAFT_504413 [Karstenula rhodostoma CBS 690.94]
MALNPAAKPFSPASTTPDPIPVRIRTEEPTWRYLKEKSSYLQGRVERMQHDVLQSMVELQLDRLDFEIKQTAIPKEKLVAWEEDEHRISSLRKLLRERTKVWRKNMDSLDEAHMKLCRYLAWLMRTKLPRELRDMIYAYACVEEKPLWIKRVDPVEPVSIKEMRDAQHEDITSSSISRFCWSKPFEEYHPSRYHLPHCETNAEALDEWELLHSRTILDGWYVGTQVAVEAAEIYYSQNTFHIEYDQTLWGFLRYDMMGLRITPADYVRKLYVVLRCEALRLAEPQNSDQELIQSRRHVAGRYYTETSAERPYMYNPEQHQRLEVTFLVTTQFEEHNLDAQRICYNLAEEIWPLMQDWSCAADLRGIFHENGHQQGVGGSTVRASVHHTGDVGVSLARA